MMGPDIAVQRAIRLRLVASSQVTALVPATSIVDRGATPFKSPSIILGESTLQPFQNFTTARVTRVFHTMHVWAQGPSLEGVKDICREIVTAIRASRLDLGPGLHCVDWRIASGRALRDPNGETGHGVLTAEVVVEEIAA